MLNIIVLLNRSYDLNIDPDIKALLMLSNDIFIIDINHESKHSLYTTLKELVYREHTMLFYTGHGHKDDIIRNSRGIEFDIKDIINAIPCHTLYSVLDCCNIEHTNLNYMYHTTDLYYWKLIKFPINNFYNKKVLIISTRQPYNHLDDGSYLTLYIVSLIQNALCTQDDTRHIKLDLIIDYNDYGRTNIILHTNDITLSSIELDSK